LSIVRVLDALERASMEQNKKGQTGEWIQYGILKNRILVEYPRLTASSVPVLVSRYLKKAVIDGYVEKEKRGRNAFYRITADGGVFLLGRRDQLDDKVVQWHEAGVDFGYMSFAVAPAGSPLIIERHREDGSLHDVEEVDDFMKKIKKKNPGLRSMYLRFE